MTVVRHDIGAKPGFTFDNRTAMDRVGLTGLQRRFDTARSVGRNHFGVEIEDRKIGYCYIRKNACSSFKKLFLDMSPHRARHTPDLRPIDFIRRFHRLSLQDLATCDHLVFVYRDPVERLLSMFRNKFIAATGATDFSAGFARITGRAPVSATFRFFVDEYLRHNFARLDRHVQSQAMHLQRVIYTDVIEIGDLHAGMVRVVGQEIADTYFLRPVNRTSHVPLVHLPGGADRPVADLREIYARDRTMPDDASLLTKALSTRLSQRYAADYKIIEAVQDVRRR